MESDDVLTVKSLIYKNMNAFMQNMNAFFFFQTMRLEIFLKIYMKECDP